MNGIYSGIFYQTQFSTGSLILSVFSLTFALFFLIGKNRSKATKNMGIAFALLSLFHLALFSGFSFYHPYAAYHRWVTVTAVLFTQIHIILFVVHYPADRNTNKAIFIKWMLYFAAACFACFFIFSTMKSGLIFIFDGHYWDIDNRGAGFAAGIAIIILALFSAAVVIWRFIQLKKNELYWMLLITIPFLIGMIIPSVMNVLNRQGAVSREIVQATLNISHMSGFFVMALIHLNTTRDRFTFMGKIVGVSIVTFLTIFLVVIHLYTNRLDDQFNKMRIDELQLGLAGKLKDPDYRYIAASDLSEKKITTVFSDELLEPSLLINLFEFKNLRVIETVKNFTDEKFSEQMESLIKLKSDDIALSGYVNLFKELLHYLPDESKSLFFAQRVEQFQHSLRFHYKNIASLSDEKFSEELQKYLKKTSGSFTHFRKAIENITTEYKMNDADYRAAVLSIISAMPQAGSVVFRESSTGERFISYLIEDFPSEAVVEGGFPYLKYRESLHAPTARLAGLIIGVMLFMIIGYPWLYFGTLYIPLRELLKGVEEVKSGNMNFRLEIKSEDEIGLLTDRFNLMVNRLVDDREKLLQSEKKYRELTDLLPDIIYETDINLNITYLNRAGFVLTGYSEEDLWSGLSLRDMLKITEAKQLASFISGSDSGNDIIFSRNQEIIRKDGKKFLGDNSAVIISEKTQVKGIRGIIRDITDKKMNEDALIQMQKMDNIGTLASGIAHDFNNILGGITGPLSLIKFMMSKGGDVDMEELSLLLSTIENSSSRAISIVRQLLSLSHKSPSLFIPVDLTNSIRNIFRICTSTFDKSIELVLDIPETECITEGDPTQIEQAILNLCINANHAMTLMRSEDETPGGRLTTVLKLTTGDHSFRVSHPSASADYYWNITISDTGVGMDHDTVSKIFVPFFTTKEKESGTGLGLSMVYSIIRNHRGFIDVYSVKDKGSAFNIYLPLIKPDRISCNEPLAEIPAGDGTILVVDDEEMIRLTAKMILEKCGYKVILASDGPGAVDLLKNSCESIDLVIIDLIMPGASGDQVISDIKRFCSPDIKIILASGLNEDYRIEKTIASSGCVFVQKPFDLQTLSKTVYDILKK